MSRKFITEKEFALIEKLNKELIQDIIGQEVIYYAISEEHTLSHDIYREAINKIWFHPIRINALVNYDNPSVLSNNMGLDSQYSVEVYFHTGELEDRNIVPRDGDFIEFGQIVYEITAVTQPQLTYGQVQQKIMTKCMCTPSREGQFQVHNNTKMFVDNTHPVEDPVCENPIEDANENQPLSALSAGFSYTVSALTVSFVNESEPSRAPIVANFWDFGDNTTVINSDPTHIFSVDGIHNVSLTAIDSEKNNSVYSENVPANVTQAVITSSDVTSSIQNSDIGDVYFVDVPEDRKLMMFKTIEHLPTDTNALDIYAREGNTIKEGQYDVSHEHAGRSSKIMIRDPSNARYSFFVKKLDSLSSYGLYMKISEEKEDVEELTNGTPAVLDYGGFQYRKINVPVSASSLSIETGQTSLSGFISGDPDLYVSYGELPTTGSFDNRSWNIGPDEDINISSPSDGYWYILVIEYTGGSNNNEWGKISLTASYTL